MKVSLESVHVTSKEDSPEADVAEEIFLRLREEQRGMRIVRISRDVRSVSWTGELTGWNELTVDHLARHGAPYHVEAHGAGHSNACANCSALGV